jgi:putative ABC transport system permease protein
LLAGLVPALKQGQQDLQSALKQGGKTAAMIASRRAQNLFVVIEIALSLVLLVGATLLVRTFVALQNVEPGFRADSVLTFQLNLPGTRYPWGRKAEFFHQLEAQLARLPGVEAVGTTSHLRFTGKGYGAGYSWDEHSMHESLTADWRFITPNYVQTTGTRLLAGRFFTEQDDAAHPRVVIIDETLARKAFPGESALGKRLLISDSTPRGMIDVWMEVIGVIEHVYNHALSAPGREQVYIPYAQTPAVPWMNVAVRSTLQPADLQRAIEQEVHELDKDLPINNVRPLQSYVADTLAPARFSLILMNLFGAVALGLAAIGLYGVLAYAVSQRTPELGIRQALGAQKRDILKLVLKQGMKVALAGVALGLISGLAITRLMKNLLFGVAATDPVTFAGIALLLIFVAMLACYLPARRATKVDPLTALRSE